MVVLFGTLGFHPEKFLAVIPSVGAPVEHAVLYVAAQTKEEETRLSQEAMQIVVDALTRMGVHHAVREVTSPWDYTSMVRTFLQDLKGFKPGGAVFNLTGGPKTMTVAATVACLMQGIRVVYVPEELEGPGSPVTLPLLQIRYSQVLTPTQQKILRVIRQGDPSSLDGLARLLRRRNSTVSYHTDKLVRLGAIQLEGADRQRSRRPILTEAGEIMLLAEEALAGRAAIDSSR